MIPVVPLDVLLQARQGTADPAAAATAGLACLSLGLLSLLVMAASKHLPRWLQDVALVAVAAFVIMLWYPVVMNEVLPQHFVPA